MVKVLVKDVASNRERKLEFTRFNTENYDEILKIGKLPIIDIIDRCMLQLPGLDRKDLLVLYKGSFYIVEQNGYIPIADAQFSGPKADGGSHLVVYLLQSPAAICLSNVDVSKLRIDELSFKSSLDWMESLQEAREQSTAALAQLILALSGILINILYFVQYFYEFPLLLFIFSPIR